MKKIFLFLGLLYPPLGFSKGFIIKGTIAGVSSGTVSLEYVKADGEDTTLSTSISNGAFLLGGILPEPELVRLNISGTFSYSTSFYLENATILVTIVKDAPQTSTITGSVSNDIYQLLKPGQMRFFSQARDNEAAHQQAAENYNKATLHTADLVWNTQQQDWMKQIMAAVKGNIGDYAALYFIKWLLFRPGNYDAIKGLYKQLSQSVQTSIAGKKFLTEFDQLYIA